ncbi:hypothetical protein QBC37DRAFT_420688 [Rhypophila decipiens]|uniref:DNA/RNA-binding protein Alba-like domain-containing protein n=1 Tax=Rhypophila decipiens TaxID=261697 RepID=A0AAN6YAZ4_9PEZI|nr:hypothetical protein QBC37DRAFT_420688 [Rhypophila decipiens]
MAAFVAPEPRNSAKAKRKFASSGCHDPNPKKPRVADIHAPASHPSHLPSQSLEPFRPLLDRLKLRYEVKPMSVMPSTKIGSHITKVIDHLSRFSPWDQAVLPGVVLLTAKSVASAKLIGIAEVVRRRIEEGEQKWYQYNVLNETEFVDQPPPPLQRHPQSTAIDLSVVEDTFMAADNAGDENEDDDDDDYFERLVAATTIHEQAVNPTVIKHKPLMAVFISRVPLGELKSLPNIGLQSNEGKIEYLRKKKMGLVA